MKQDLIIKKEFFLKTRSQPFEKIYFVHPKKLGQGSFGSVYKVKQKAGHNAAWRAAKIIQKKLKNTPQLQNEIHILKKLDHPNIIRIYQIFQSETTTCIVQDFCEGGGLLQQLSTNGPYSEINARKIFRQTLEAINYCHRNKICHRDIKLGNILFLKKDSLELKLVDFGLAIQWNESMQLQLSKLQKQIVGTAHYIAPQIISEEAKYDQRCDIWSLGVILYIMLSGQIPFNGTKAEQIFQNIRSYKYSLDIPQMKPISHQAKDLIKKILVPEKQRISIEQMLKHPWMANQPKKLPMKINSQNFKAYSKFSKIKKIVASLIASQLPSLQVEQLTKMFQQMDINKQGQISLQVMRNTLSKEGIKQDQIRQIMEFIDADRNGRISYNEFIASALGNTIYAEPNIKRAFNMLDDNGNGFVQKQQLLKLFQQCGISTYQGKNVEDIIKQCDRDGNGIIDYNQFQEVLLRKS